MLEEVKNLFEGIEISVDEWIETIKAITGGGDVLISIGGKAKRINVENLKELLDNQVGKVMKDVRIYLSELNEIVDNGRIRSIEPKERGRVYAVWLDIDRGEDEAKRIEGKLPEATYRVFTGRYWALVWFLEDGMYEIDKRNDFEELKNLMLQLVDDDEIKKEMKSKHITNAMIRVINTINTKTGKSVSWFRVRGGKIWKVEDLKRELIERGAVLERQEEKQQQGDRQGKTEIERVREKGTSISTTTKIPNCLNHCGLGRFLWNNFDEGLKYEGWRFLSYFAVLNKEFRREFEIRSKDWEGKYPERVEQTTEKRLKISEKDLQKGGGFFYCSTISEFSVEGLEIFHSRLNFHPCIECPFRNYNRRPYELFGIPEGYELKGNVLYKGSREIAVNFDLNKIEKIVISDDYENMWIFVRDEDGKVKELDFEKENELRLFFEVVGNIQVFKDFLIKFKKENEHIIYKKPSFSGYDNGVWKILWRDYFTPVVSENFDLSEMGDVKKWKEEWFNICDFVIREKDVITALMIGTALRFLKRDYWGFTPAVALLGEKGSGKTLRLKIINSLIRKPVVVDYHQMTSAFLSNNIGKIKGFITIDEFWTTGVEDERTLSLLGLLNISGKFTAKGKYPENYNPILIAGEDTSFRSWGKQGLNRRVLRLILKKDDEEKWKKYVDFYPQSLKILERNYGFLYEIANEILKVESEIIGELNLKIKVEEREHKEMIEKALRNFFALCVALGVCKIEDVYELIDEFASLTQKTQNISSEKAIQQAITRILDVLNEIFEIKKRKSNVDLDEVLLKVPSATSYNNEITLILCDKWVINKFEDRFGESRKYIKSFAISKNTPLFKVYKGEGGISLKDFLKHIDEKREKMKNEYGEDRWKEIKNERVADLVSLFFTDDLTNDKSNDDDKRNDDDDDDEIIYFD
jgi:hypothetical protein